MAEQAILTLEEARQEIIAVVNKHLQVIPVYIMDMVLKDIYNEVHTQTQILYQQELNKAEKAFYQAELNKKIEADKEGQV